MWTEKADRAKRKFRQIVRQVINNLYWLKQVKLGSNIKHNVDLIYNKRIETAGNLTFEDKVCLRKPPENRTEEELLHVYKNVEQLRCWKFLPEFLKKKVIAEMYFLYFGEKRTIVKQGGDSWTLNIIISGKVDKYEEVCLIFFFLNSYRIINAKIK